MVPFGCLLHWCLTLAQNVLGKPSENFLADLAEAAREFSPRARYLIGVSGGADSMALLRGLERLGFRKLVVCHVHHGLRAEADGEMAFVARVAEELGMKFFAKKMDVAAVAKGEGISIETAARNVRHACWGQWGRQTRCARIFLAHHREDQVETILHHFFRGSGRRGLGGMQRRGELKVGRKRMELLRPMLGIDPAVARRWLVENGFCWCEDASNASLVHTRNRLRHDLIPRLEGILGRDFRGPILRLAEILRAEEDVFEGWTADLWSKVGGEKLSVKGVRQEPLALQRRVVRKWLLQCGVEAGFREVEAVVSLLGGGQPARIHLSGGRQARRRQGLIFLD